MPIRAAQPADAASIVTCVNAMWTYLRSNGRINPNVGDWTIATLQRLNNAGYKGWVYATAAGRVDAVCIYRIENRNHPIAGFPLTANVAPWMTIPFLCVRPSVIANTTAARRTYFWRALKLAIPEAVNSGGAVGIVCEYDARHQELHDLIAANFPATANFEVDSDEAGFGATERCWLPIKSTALPDFTAITAGIT